jgi:DNA-binding MarR family transcriptional regulator
MLKELNKLSLALSVIRVLDDSIPAQTLAVFLEIARHGKDGISVAELATTCGLAGSSASRNVAALSEWHWLKRPGLGLVVAECDPMDTRRKIIRLTAKGERVVAQWVAIMGRE